MMGTRFVSRELDHRLDSTAVSNCNCCDIADVIDSVHLRWHLQA